MLKLPLPLLPLLAPGKGLALTLPLLQLSGDGQGLAPTVALQDVRLGVALPMSLLQLLGLMAVLALTTPLLQLLATRLGTALAASLLQLRGVVNLGLIIGTACRCWKASGTLGLFVLPTASTTCLAVSWRPLASSICQWSTEGVVLLWRFVNTGVRSRTCRGHMRMESVCSSRQQAVTMGWVPCLSLGRGGWHVSMFVLPMANTRLAC